MKVSQAQFQGLPEAPARSAPSLLVSVRSLREARAALLGGAAILDVKEPSRGPLGRASEKTHRLVAREAARASISSERVMVTAALGELREWRGETRTGAEREWEGVQGIALYKLGLSGCGGLSCWRSWLDGWRRRLGSSGGAASLVAVAYADHQRAEAPSCHEVLDYALERGLPFMLIDTFDKRSGRLPDWLSASAIRELITTAHRGGVRVALAGSLRAEDLEAMARHAPDVIAVRGAACAGGEREETVDAGRVADLLRRLHFMPWVHESDR